MSEKPFMRALKGEVQATPPIWLMRQAGRYLPEYRALREKTGSFLDMCYTPDLAVEITLQPIRRYAFDAAILFSDILVIPDALGREVRFVAGEGPRLNPIVDLSDLPVFDPDRLDAHLDPVYRAVKGLADSLPDRVALIGFAGAPWTIATYMIEGRSGADFLTVRDLAYRDPQGFERLMDCLVRATGHYLSRQIEAGAEAVKIFDSWSGVLAASEFEKWVIEPFVRLVKLLKGRYPEVPILGFPRGCGVHYADFSMKTDIDALAVDHMTPLAWLHERLPENVVIQGNLDPLLLRLGGDAMTETAKSIVIACKNRPHVFNLGHGVMPDTDPDHVSRLIDTVRNGAV